ncbi:hypothetical protein ER57_04705 [Smithella sp. SCADC]|nr:hypothetical protein ER57_04705 [Smithella sp. SCADC]HAR48795.1 hypothetical protein [Smithella sp.]
MRITFKKRLPLRFKPPGTYISLKSKTKILIIKALISNVLLNKRVINVDIRIIFQFSSVRLM